MEEIEELIRLWKKSRIWKQKGKEGEEKNEKVKKRKRN